MLYKRWSGLWIPGIYWVPCSCEMFSIGQTGHSILERAAEHDCYIRLKTWEILLSWTLSNEWASTVGFHLCSLQGKGFFGNYNFIHRNLLRSPYSQQGFRTSAKCMLETSFAVDWCLNWLLRVCELNVSSLMWENVIIFLFKPGCGSCLSSPWWRSLV